MVKRLDQVHLTSPVSCASHTLLMSSTLLTGYVEKWMPLFINKCCAGDDESQVGVCMQWLMCCHMGTAGTELRSFSLHTHRLPAEF